MKGFAKPPPVAESHPATTYLPLQKIKGRRMENSRPTSALGSSFLNFVHFALVMSFICHPLLIGSNP